MQRQQRILFGFVQEEDKNSKSNGKGKCKGNEF